MFAIVAGCAAAADPARFSVPVLGYVPDDAAKSIRPVAGFPGAAVVGGALDLGSAKWTAVSPRQDFAIATDADAVRIVSLTDFTSRILTSALDRPSSAFFSPNGTAIALYRRSRSALRIFTQLPETPAPGYQIDLGILGANLQSAAISDDGELALLLAGSPGNATLWLSRSGGVPVKLDAPSSLAAIGFESGRDRAIAAAQDGSLYLFDNLSTGQESRLLLPASNRLASPAAVAFSSDAARVLVATRAGDVAAVGVADGATVFASCGCRPTTLSPLSSHMLRLNELSGGPLMLVDTADPQLHVWFVPAIREGSAQ